LAFGIDALATTGVPRSAASGQERTAAGRDMPSYANLLEELVAPEQF
jgi:hypothetical protein